MLSVPPARAECQWSIATDGIGRLTLMADGWPIAQSNELEHATDDSIAASRVKSERIGRSGADSRAELLAQDGASTMQPCLDGVLARSRAFRRFSRAQPFDLSKDEDNAVTARVGSRRPPPGAGHFPGESLMLGIWKR